MCGRNETELIECTDRLAQTSKLDAIAVPHVASSHWPPVPYIYRTQTFTSSVTHKSQAKKKKPAEAFVDLLHEPHSMPPETTSEPSESGVSSTIFKDTELTLGLPGDARSPALAGSRTCTKRGFIETVDLNLGSSTSKPRGKTLADEDDKSENIVTGAGKAPAAK